MNDISKTNIKTKLEKAMESEDIRSSEAARIFGINPSYISMIKNPDTWVKCPISGWEEVLKWVNSGQGLKEYSEKHGKILPYKAEEIKLKEKLQKLPQEQDKKVLFKESNNNQKITIDIEINLIINGKKITL